MSKCDAINEPERVGHNSASMFDVEQVRSDFPILSREVYSKPLVFLDSGASAQKPRAVIGCISEAYESYYSDVHPGAYFLSQQATDAYEEARVVIANFMNAPSDKNIVFTSHQRSVTHVEL